jgi:hypothetical protein
MMMFKHIQKIQSSPLMNKPRQLSFSFRSLLAREPALWPLYQPYLWWSKVKLKAEGGYPEERTINPDTELVIDGFQGSANSFATVAFQLSQKRHVRLAHHLHAPTQIMQAIELGIPVWLTIREPVDTVISLTSRWSYVSVIQGLQSYIEFYSKLEPYTANCVISRFDQTTQRLDQVIEVVNAKFGTHFDLVDVARANLECRPKASDAPEKEARREAIKQKKKREIAAAKNAPLLARANHLYQRFEAFSEQQIVSP